MPVLRPVPIETSDANILIRIWLLLTVVRKWEVVEDWRVILPDGAVVIIPAGFIMDGASIPRLLWIFISPTGILLIPGILHDFAYAYDYLWLENGGKYQQGAGQAFWDKLFYDVSLKVNSMVISDAVAYYSLRAFGFIAWSNARFKRTNELVPNFTEIKKDV